MNFLIDAFQPGTDRDTFGGLDFVSSQHPNFDAAHSQRLNCSRNFILQLILHSCDTNQVHIMLKFHHNFSHCFVSVFKQVRGLVVLLVPFLVIILVQLLLSNDQSSQSFTGQVVALVLNVSAIYWLAFLYHHHISSL